MQDLQRSVRRIGDVSYVAVGSVMCLLSLAASIWFWSVEVGAVDPINNSGSVAFFRPPRMSVGDISGAAPTVDAPSAPSPDASQPASTPAPAPASAGFGIEFDSHQVHAETEQTQFHADVVVHTTDGQEIHATVDLAMSRSFTEQTDVSIRAGDAVKKDPLVVNFGGTAAQLQSQRVSFDLAGDGQQVQMPLLSGNSGYLALDLNGNHKVDSGKELFGATSGNGFADLARYDSDGNGWIDENDPIFKQLSVWTPVADASGKAGGNLSTLAQSGVGALYLGQVATPFALKDGANSELGAVRASGIFLNEDGSAGTLQQIDLMV